MLLLGGVVWLRFRSHGAVKHWKFCMVEKLYSAFYRQATSGVATLSLCGLRGVHVEFLTFQ